MSAFVTLVNRSSKILNGTWDGRHYDIAPGNHSFPELQALKFKDQNPLMGSEDPVTLDKTYLIGIVEHGDDTFPLEQASSITLQDLSKKINSGELKVIAGNGLYSQAKDGSKPFNVGGAVESEFTKP